MYLEALGLREVEEAEALAALEAGNLDLGGKGKVLCLAAAALGTADLIFCNIDGVDEEEDEDEDEEDD